MPVTSHHILSSHFKFLIRLRKQHIIYQNECNFFISRSSCSSTQSQTFGNNIFRSVVLCRSFIFRQCGLVVMRDVEHEQDLSDQVEDICKHTLLAHALGCSPTIPMPESVMRALLGPFPIGSLYRPCCSQVQEDLLSKN